jgi:ligand-binding sensor domain-containing protein/signal transduction histidine kinase
MKIRLFLIILITFNVLIAISGTPDFYFKHLTTSDGLTNSNVQYVYQDHKGFMWFCTDDGLNMYDGYDFTIYRNQANDSSSLSSNTVFRILEDSKKQFWVATSNGVDLFDRANLRFKHIPFLVRDRQFQNYIRAIDEDNEGNIIVASPTGVYIFDAKKQGFVRFFNESGDSIQQEGIRDLVIDKSNRIWIGSVGYGLYGYDLNNNKVVASIKSKEGICLKKEINSLFEDENGDLWICTENGIYIIKSDLSDVRHIDLQSETSSIGSNMVHWILFEDKDRIWIATDGGLVLHSREKNTYMVYKSNEYSQYSLNNNLIRSIFKDRQGILWIGTFQAGVNYTQLAPIKKFKQFKYEKGNPNSLSYEVVSSIYQDSDSLLWIGTDGGGLDKYDPASGTYTHFRYKPGIANSISGNSILVITEDPSGRIWIGGYLSGIDIIDKSSGQISHLKNIPGNTNSLSNNDVRDILFDKKGRAWILTNGGGLNIYNPENGEFLHFIEGGGNSLVSNWGIKLFQDSKGKIWIGTYNGLSICDPETMIFTNYARNNSPGSISNSWVYSFAEDKSGTIWIGTANGLNYYSRNTKKFTRILATEGLPNEVINGILGDENNNLWISSNQGIARYSPDEKKFRNYNVNDGLQGSQFVHGAYYKSKSGELFFGGMNGLNSFYPDEIKDNVYKPDIYFRDLLIFYKTVNKYGKGEPLEKSIEMAEEVVLDYRQSVVTFKFAALNYINPEKNQYAYMLDGFDDEWISVGSRREATYTNLSQGTYYFKIKASNDDNIWNEKGISIKVIVLPPWWKTWIFRIFLVLLIIATVLLIFYLRVSDLKKQKIILEETVKQRTFEITEKNKKLRLQADELSEINSLLEEKQQRIQQQSEFLSEANSLLEERQQQISEQTEELMAQKDELEKVNTHLKELNSTKDKFFSIIAHDLKNPFGTILGFAELLMINFDQIKEDKKREFISIIYRSSQNLFNLLENLLLWSRSQTNRIRFEPTRFSLNELMQENITLLDEMINNKKISLIFKPEKNYEIYADKNMLSTVIRNLVTNAVKFTRTDGIIDISINTKGSDFIVAVSDTGIGMTKKEADQLFKTDAHFSKEGTAGEGGTGLGLILCREYIDKHMGEIWAESIEGKGSTFYFTIPDNSRI